MQPTQRYLITAALPYANGPLHIGHIAGAYLPADIFARYQKLKGQDVAFISGSDEHGAAITLRAKKEGMDPSTIVDRYHEENSRAFERFGITFDIYHRTSSELHHQTAQGFFKKLYDQGAFTERTDQQYFDEEHQQFLADRYITGTCPKCGNDKAFGDQCESCGSSLSPNELIDPISTLSGKPPVLRKTTHWYLPMGQHEEWLRAYISEGKLDGKQHHDPKEWKDHVLGQCLSWIDGGLHDRAMTRDLDWGVPVPIEGTDGKVLYVWLDAPIGYISATKQWAEDHGKNWEDYWKDENTKLIHFIGKDNIVFHCIIFPIILHEYDDGFILPHNVPANGFLNLEGDKISTSRNWAVWLDDFLEEWPGQEDVLRYALTANAPENRDSEFTWKDFQDRNNNELVGVFGNFVHRALVLTHKYFGGVVPEQQELTKEDESLIEAVKEYPAKIGDLIERYRFREAQLETMNLARAGNKYLADSEPWKVIKQDEERVKTILFLGLQVAANLAVLFHPFLPFTSRKLQKMLGMETLDMEQAGRMDILPAGHQLEKAALLFEKVEDEAIEKQKQRLEAQSKEQQESKAEPVKDAVQFGDFTKLDIRTATVLKAEKVPKTKKLLKLELDTGVDTRTVVAGAAEHYAPEEVVGRNVCVLLNLEPKRIKGVDSQGMVLMAEDDNGTLRFLDPGEVLKGSTVR